MEDDYISIKAEDGNSINLSLYSGGDIWVSLFQRTAYASTMLNKKQATELRDALNALLRS